MRALSARQHEGKRRIIVGAVPGLELDGVDGTSPHCCGRITARIAIEIYCGGYGPRGGTGGAPRRSRRSAQLRAAETAVANVPEPSRRSTGLNSKEADFDRAGTILPGKV